MKKMLLTVLAVAGAMTSTQAMAAKLVLGGNAQAKMTYTTLAQVATSVTSQYSGVGSLFVSRVSTATTGFGSICTGSLVGSTAVLTAAHCLADSVPGDAITSIRFLLPSLGAAASAREIFFATEFALAPEYASTGLVGGHDVAMFSIRGDTTGYDKYGLFEDDPLQQFTMVGTGTIGGPQGTGIGVRNDYRKRIGTNVFEYYGDEIFSDVGSGVALYDFDDGTLAHDVFGRNLGNVQLGVDGEASASPGDSGGPSFIDGKIAAVTSFGVTGGIFQGYCGGNSTDPFNQQGGTALTALGGCTNSSVGEIGGNTLVSANRNFIDAYLAGNVQTIRPVPEPSTWALLLVGFGMVGGCMRTRKKAGAKFAIA